jgi:serine/threonine protein kinase/uncharacterized RDD family membrane protein YckC
MERSARAIVHGPATRAELRGEVLSSVGTSPVRESGGVSAGTTFASDTSAASTRGRVLHRRARGDSMTKRVDAGTPIGEWVLEEKLGQGTFGEVWRARHRALRDRLAAVKVPRDPAAVERLVAEGKLLARLPIPIPGAVALLGADADHDPPYLALEYVEGESLRRRLSRGPLAPERAVATTRAVLETLRAAHRIGVIHRDVKPENVLIDATGRVRLTDFGLAATRDDASASVSASGSIGSEAARVVGTLGYMAPEQRDPARAVDHRADLFATGLVFFEMLTGTLPEGSEVPSDLVASLEPSFDDFFRHCHARLDRRFADADAALQALAGLESVLAARRLAAVRAEAFAKRLVELRSPSSCSRTIALDDPNLIGWDEARAILRTSSADMRRWIESRALKLHDGRGRPLFRRSDVVELRDRLRRAAPPLAAPVPVAASPAVAAARPVPRGPTRPPRALARSIGASVDVVISCALASAVAGWVSVAAGGPLGPVGIAVAHPTPSSTPFAAGVGMTIVVGALYVILATWIFCRTMGQWFVGIRVLGPDGGGVGFIRSATRLALMPFSALPLGAGLLGIFFDPDARALHDALTNTRVVFED